MCAYTAAHSLANIVAATKCAQKQYTGAYVSILFKPYCTIKIGATIKYTISIDDIMEQEK